MYVHALERKELEVSLKAIVATNSTPVEREHSSTPIKSRFCAASDTRPVKSYFREA